MNFDDVWDFLTSHKINNDECIDLIQISINNMKYNQEEEINEFTFVEDMEDKND